MQADGLEAGAAPEPVDLASDLEPAEHRVALGYVVGASYRMTREATILFELEHNYSRELGQQLRFLAMLDLGFWI